MSRGGSVPGEPVSVLHVDPDSAVPERLAAALGREANVWDVDAERDPADALARFDTSEFDCLVAEYDLPGMDGVELLGAVRERDNSFPVVLYTDDGNEAVASRAISAGVTEYVRKESDGIDALARRVQRIVDAGGGLSETGSQYGHRQLSRFVQAFPDAVFVMDEQGRYLDILSGGEQSLLYSDPDELLGHRYHEVLPAETADRFLDTVRRALETGEQQQIEYQLDVQKGTRWFEARVGPLQRQSAPRTVFWIARDITEQKQREQEYEQIFNNVNDAICVFDPERAAIVDANDAYHELLGYDDLETIRDMGIEGLSATEEGYTGARGWELIQEVSETGAPKTVEWRGETSDGERRWLEATLAPAEIGGADRVLSIQRDVTERRRREREYEQIFNSVNDIIAVRDPGTGELVDVNQSYADLLGYDREQMRGMAIEDVGVPEEGYDEHRGMQHLRAVMQSDEPIEFDWKVEDAAGRTHLMEVQGTAAVINGERRYLAIGRDVTERKRRERAINRLQEATERLQTATTPAEVATIAVETASDVLELPMAICWFHDDESGRLEPAGATDAVREAGLVSGLSADRYEYDVFEDGRVTEYTPSEEGAENPLETGVLLPLGDRGLVAAGTRQPASADATVLDVAKALADHVTTALDRVERAAAVRESERRFRLIAERIDEGIFLAEPDFSDILYVNPAYEEIWGRPIEGLEHNAWEFVEAADHRDRDEIEAAFEAMIADIQAGDADDSYEFEYRIRRPDGQLRWVNGTWYAVALPGGKRRFVGIVEDTTGRKRREQRLEVFNRILRHNLRNQLDVIRSHAEVLSDRGEDGHAEQIIASVDELAAIGAEARETDRVMSMDEQLRAVSISETVGRTVETVGSDPSGIDLVTEIEPTRPVTVNEEAVEIAVESALENAIEHATSRVTVTVEQGASGAVVAITDDGPGIPEEQLVPIETGRETNLQHGRGLGLWQLRWSVDKLNGELSFETAAGTTVRIRIPDQRESAPASEDRRL